MMMQAVETAVARPRNDRAVCQLRAWLQAVGIDCVSSRCGNDLSLRCHNGNWIEVAVVFEGGEVGTDALAVPARQIADYRQEVALAAFHRVTTVAGYGRPQPVDRGQTPDHKLRYDNNFELVSMRHCEFRRVPNPSVERFAYYKPVIERAARHFLRTNIKICARNGLELGDLLTYAQVWAANYMGLYEVQNPGEHENQRKLHAHLQQRFSEFRGLLFKKGRCMFVDDATVHVALNLDADAGAEAEADYVQKHAQLDTRSKDSRRASAARLLADGLSQLSHDRLVAVLGEAVENQALCADTRREAQRQLRKHCHSCTTCAAPAAVEAVAAPAVEADVVEEMVSVETEVPGKIRVRLPQADKLPTVRAFVQAVHNGVSTVAAFSAVLGFGPRTVSFYRSAADLLGLTQETDLGIIVTDLGRALLATPEGSAAQRLFLAQIIKAATPLQDFAAYLTGEESVARDCIQDRIVATGASRAVAERRSAALSCWRNYLAA